jgi:hypothetical protein
MLSYAALQTGHRTARANEDLAMTVAAPPFRTKAFIDGEFRDAESGETFGTDNPATGRKTKPARRGVEGGRTDERSGVPSST